MGEPEHAAHHELARRAAAESTVLLTNDGILPLAAGTRVAVVGAFGRHPRFQGFGSSLVNPTRVDTLVDALTERGVLAGYAPGYDPADSVPDEALLAEAERVAADADVVVAMVGLPGVDESEGFDRTHLGLPPQHDALVRRVCAANPRTIVVLSNGSPVAMPWVGETAAILEAYLGGQASGSALGDVLYGDREPVGRLAETFPVRQSDVPSDQWFPGAPHQVEYREGLSVGYRAAGTVPEPLFAFGHGLGYTTFEFGDPQLDRTRIRRDGRVLVTVPVTNTGAVPARWYPDLCPRHDRCRAPAASGAARVRQGAPGTGRLDRCRRRAGAEGVSPTSTRSGSRGAAGIHAIEVGASSADIRGTADLTITGSAPATQDGGPLVARGDAAFSRRLGRPIPRPRPDRPFTRLTTVGELRETSVGRAVRAALHRYTRGQFEQMADGDALMAERLAGALDEMPLRGVVLFAGGVIPWSALDSLIAVLNGRPVTAAGQMTSGLTRWARRRLPGL
ncbi:MAG: glycoside hydrolase family 3 C-terminal domain-containing protein [Candidatus Nanopelagicales bacterium]